MAPEFQDALERAAERYAPGKHVRMPSAAGHDAQIFARHLKAGMLFIPSIGGISHHFAEDTSDVDIVNGYKISRSDPLGRIIIGTIYHSTMKLLFGFKIRDVDCDFRLIRRSLLDTMALSSTSGTICVELVRKLELSQYSVVEVGVHHYPRTHGRSQFFRFRSLATTLYQLARLYVRLS